MSTETVTAKLPAPAPITEYAAELQRWFGDRLDTIERQIERMSDSITRGVGALAARVEELNERVDRHVNRVLELDAIQRKHTTRIAKLAGRVGALDGKTEDAGDL